MYIYQCCLGRPPNNFETKSFEIYQKVALAVSAVLLFTAISVPIVNHFSPRSIFFYSYLGSSLTLGTIALAFVAIRSYLKWKELQTEYDSNTVTLFGYERFEKKSESASIEKCEVPHSDLNQGGFFVLPKEILILILKMLDLRSLYKVQATCRRLYELLKKEKFWKDLFLRDFDGNSLPEKDIKKDYRVLYCLKKEIFQVYNRTISQQPKSFLLFNNKIHFPDNKMLKNEKGCIVDPKRKVTFINLDDTFLLAQGRKEIWCGVYDKNYQFQFELNFEESDKVTNQKDRKVFVLLFKSKGALYFFEKETFRCLKEVKIADAMFLSEQLILKNHLYLSTLDGLNVYDLSDFSCSTIQVPSDVCRELKHTSFEEQDYLVAKSQMGKLYVFIPSQIEKVYSLFSFTARIRDWFLFEKFLYVGLENNCWEIWDISKGKLVKTLDIFNDRMRHCIFHHFLVCVLDKKITIIDLRRHELVYSREKKEYDGYPAQMEARDEKLTVFYWKHDHSMLEIFDFRTLL